MVLAYGLCGGATAGLRAGAIPLVVPRAHDCITLFLGDRARYLAEFTANPGTYWYVQDYLERTDDGSAFGGVGAVSDASARATYEEYVAKYGEDNAAYLMEAMGGWRSHYDRAAFVEMGVAPPEAAATAEAQARDDADRRGWQFAKLAGELLLVRGLVDGSWTPEDYLVLQAGEGLAMSYDERVIRAEPGRSRGLSGSAGPGLRRPTSSAGSARISRPGPQRSLTADRLCRISRPAAPP